MDKRIVVGVDLGGSIVRAGVFDAQGKILAIRESPIEAARGPEFGLGKIQELIEQVWAESEAKLLIGIGIGSTGPVDPIKGIINNPFTLPSWENVPVIDRMQNAFNVPVTLENDAEHPPCSTCAARLLAGFEAPPPACRSPGPAAIDGAN